ncbi:MAG TPA: hypothetical protein VIY86_09590, partial [Pirellulaceae bacterium]
QNDFLSVWASHEVQRRALDYELGTMQLDPQGLWVDPGPLDDAPRDIDPSLEPLRPPFDRVELLPPTKIERPAVSKPEASALEADPLPAPGDRG